MKDRKLKNLPRALRRPVWWIALGALILLGGAGVWYALGMPGLKTASAATGPDYQTAVVRTGSLRISATGSATLISQETVDLSFPISGTVSELDVKVGDDVKAGQVLARLGSAEQLEAQVASAQLANLEAQQALKSLQSNSSVALAEAYQAYVTAQESYATAAASSVRTAYARCSESVRQQKTRILADTKERLDKLSVYDTGSDAWIDAKNNYDTALANYTYCMAYTDAEKTELSAEAQLARDQLTQAENTYNTLKASSGVDPDALAKAELSAKEAAANLASAQKSLDGITLTAPIDGKVTYVAANAGAIVGTDKYITVTDFNQPAVQVYVDDTDMDKLKVGNQAEITFDAAPDRIFTGTVTMVYPELVTSGNSSAAEGIILLDEESAALVKNYPLGLSATAEVIASQASNVTLAAVEAVRSLGDGQYGVFVVGTDGTLTFKPVEVGLQDATFAEIKSGLNAGEVVTTGKVPTSK